MKPRMLPTFGLLFALGAFTNGCFKQEASTPATADPDAQSMIAMQPVPEPDLDPLDEAIDESDEDGVSAAPVLGTFTEAAVPTSIETSGPLREIVRLAESGVEESVLLAYVRNSPSIFDLDADEIIYLNDIGVPAGVIQAILLHDRAVMDVGALESAQLEPVATAQEEPLPEPELPASDIADEGGLLAQAPEVPTEPAPGTVGYSDFYDELSPYGNWVNVEGYGRCWQPTVVVIHRNWRPYCDRGRWIYTDCGWYWASDYSWGWAPFHYGRWFQHARLGWCWTPGLVWGPSWVTWRYNHEYCGWAPLPPYAHFKPGLGLVVRGQVLPRNSDCGIKPACYTFVPFKNFHDHHLAPAVLPRRDVGRIFDRTIVSTSFAGDRHTVANHGLPVDRVMATTHTKVPRLPVREVAVRVPRGTAPQLQAGNRTVAGTRAPATHFEPSSGLQPVATPATPAMPVPSAMPVRRERSGVRTDLATTRMPQPAVQPRSQNQPAANEAFAGAPANSDAAEPARPALPRRRGSTQTAQLAPQDLTGLPVTHARQDMRRNQPEPIRSLPHQPSWVQTESPEMTPSMPATPIPRQAVMPRAEATGNTERLHQRQQQAQIQRQDQPREPIILYPPAQQNWTPPPARMAPQPVAPPPAAVTAPVQRNEPVYQHSRASGGEQQARPAPAVEQRSQPAPAESRSDSGRGTSSPRAR